MKIRAVDAAGNHDASPPSTTWTVDSTGPSTTISSKPLAVDGPDASFSFSGSDAGGTGVASYQCKLDSGAFASCTSPKSYTGLSDGDHTFTVRAVDSVGNADPAPAAYAWHVDTSAPSTSVSSGPPATTTSTSATFVFSGTDGSGPVTTFQCQLDGGAYAPCTSPKTYTGLSDGDHTVKIRAVDSVGNVDPLAADLHLEGRYNRADHHDRDQAGREGDVGHRHLHLHRVRRGQRLGHRQSRVQARQRLVRHVHFAGQLREPG